MYKQYEQPEMKIISLKTEDVIMASAGENPDLPDGGGLDFP